MEDTIIIRKDAPFLVRLTPSLKRDLLAKAEGEGMTGAELVRRAIRYYIEPHECLVMARIKAAKGKRK